MKVEEVVKLRSRQLKTVDVTNIKLHKRFSEWNLGRKTFKLLKKVGQEDQDVFKSAVIIAFTQAAQYLQKKLPLDNKFLYYLSAIDPKCHGVEVACRAMKKLGSFFPNIIKEEELDTYDADVDKFHLLKNLPTWKDEGKAQRVDHWWHEVLEKNNLVCLGKVVKASLSICTGPYVEQSFSLMNNTITSTTNRLLTSTFSALQTVKMDLLASKQKSSQRFFRRNFLKSPINPWVCKGIQKSAALMKKRRNANRKRNAERLDELGIKAVPKKKKKTMHQRAEEVKNQCFSKQREEKKKKKQKNTKTTAE